jgi:methyl-CpG-binding domain protein 4
MESKVTAEGAAVRKKQRRRKVEQEQSGQPPFPIDVHPQAGEEAAAGGGVMGSQCVKRSSSKKSWVLKKKQPLPQGFFPPMANPNSIDQDPNYSSPFGAFFAQFAYKPDRRKDGSGPPLPNTVDCPVRLPPQGHPSSGSSLLTAKETSKAARTTTSNTKQPCPASASTSSSQEEVRVKRKEKPENKMTREMAVRESPCPLANPEYRSDSPVSVAPETLTSAEMIAIALRQVKERERKNQEALPASPLMEEPVRKEEKKHKKRKNAEAAVVIPSPPTAAVAQISQRESKVTPEEVTLRKKHRRQKVEQEQSGQPPFPIDVHPQGGEEAAGGGGGVMGSLCQEEQQQEVLGLEEAAATAPRLFPSHG